MAAIHTHRRIVLSMTAERAPDGDLRNPDFDAMTGWQSTAPAEMYLLNGQLRIVGSQTQFFYQPWANYVKTPVTGVPYRARIQVRELSSGAVRLVTNSGGLDRTVYAPGYYEFDYTGDGDTFNLQSANYLGQNCNAVIDWVQLTRL